MNQCPIFVPSTQGIPPVPAQVKADIPVVLLPASDDASGTEMMGGTTLPQESSYTGYHNPFDVYRVHQVMPPHAQNGTGPCSMIDSPEDPNNGPRRCYQIMDPIQGMVGRVCNTVGADEPVDSLQTYEKSGQDGDWVRGNEFGWNYSRKNIEDRPKQVYTVPAQKQVYKQQVSLNPFFPYEGY